MTSMTLLYLLLAFMVGLGIGIAAGIALAGMVWRDQLRASVAKSQREMRQLLEQIDEITNDLKTIQE